MNADEPNLKLGIYKGSWLTFAYFNNWKKIAVEKSYT